MIVSFRSKDLKKLWTKGDASGVRPDWRRKVNMLLSSLDASADPVEMALPGYGFHALAGDQAGRYALTVSANWRITFGWSAADATDVDLEDYHGR